MTTKHTPGPWDLSGANTVHAHGAGCIVAFVGTADEEVRRVSGERQSADARLIAAAPDLLEALEAISPMLPRSLTTEAWGDPSWTEAICKVEGAIAKAKGTIE
jgi:hypothetical protein